MTDNYEVTSPQQVLSKEAANRTHEEQPFEERLEEALTDDNMHQALERFAPSWRTSRSSVFASEEADYGSEYSFANMRAALRKAKDFAIEHQEELIGQFKAQAEAAGAIIYEARTAEDANRYIYELCLRKGIDLVVKSKTRGKCADCRKWHRDDADQRGERSPRHFAATCPCRYGRLR